MTGRRVDVVVIGDGPAGSALASACAGHDLDTLLIGGDEAWSATYGSWVDDSGLPSDHGDSDHGDSTGWFASTVPSIAVFTDRPHRLDRPYGVIDNDRLRAGLRRDVEHLLARVEHVEPGVSTHHVVLDDARVVGARVVGARLVVDATGWPSTFAPLAGRGGAVQPAWQTAFGVVLREPPPGDLGEPTLMDLRPVPARGATSGDRRSTLGPVGVTTFGYSLPVADGWLVEETVLAARPAIEPVALVARLAARVGQHPDELLAEAVRSEYVRIPMGAALPSPDQPVVAFGAAAGYVHPATGYSLAASLRSAPRVAAAIAEAAQARPAHLVIDPVAVWRAVWTTSMRRTRVLHDFGLRTLLHQSPEAIREFFGAFFDLPVDRWATYLRLDSSPAETASVMAELFRSSPWSLRRRLAAGNPAALARLLRP